MTNSLLQLLNYSVASRFVRIDLRSILERDGNKEEREEESSFRRVSICKNFRKKKDEFDSSLIAKSAGFFFGNRADSSKVAPDSTKKVLGKVSSSSNA